MATPSRTLIIAMIFVLTSERNNFLSNCNCFPLLFSRLSDDDILGTTSSSPASPSASSCVVYQEVFFFSTLLPCDCCAVIDSNKAWSCSEDKVWVWKAMLLSWNMWLFYSNGIVNSCLFAPHEKFLAMLLVCAFSHFSKVEFVSTFFFATAYKDLLTLLCNIIH